MKLTRVTITGADDNTNPQDLIQLHQKYPFVEWALLFSPSRQGTARYPSHEWIKTFAECVSLSVDRDNPIFISAHLCGQYMRDIFEYGELKIRNLFKDLEIWALIKRIQVNWQSYDGLLSLPLAKTGIDEYITQEIFNSYDDTHNNEEDTFHPKWASPPWDTIQDIRIEKNISLESLQTYLKLSMNEMKDFQQGKKRITPSLALSLSSLLGSSADFWLNRDEQYKTSICELEYSHGELWVSRQIYHMCYKLALMSDNPNIQFIFQCPDGNCHILDKIKFRDDIGMDIVPLFDASGGKGKIHHEWPSPYSPYCGYAGGWNPDNLSQELEKISHLCGSHSIWIDVESGVRTYDMLDLEKVDRFLEIAEPYINKE